MSKLDNLYHPESKKNIFSDDTIKFFNGIPDLFIYEKEDLEKKQSEFYNDVKFPNYENIDDYASLLDKANKSLFTQKLDKEIPFHAKVLEAGCGTGQLSIALSRFKREIYGIDISKGSLIEGKKFIDKNNIKNVNFYRMNIFNLFFPKNYFDVIISNGVLHHTRDAKLAFKKLLYHLKPEGIVIIGLYHKYGRVFQKLKQFIFKILDSSYSNSYKKFLDQKFTSNISEKKKYAWYMDQYLNPFETTHTYYEIIDWFKENNVEYLSSIPFNFKYNDKLFFKKEKIKKPLIWLKELSLIFDLMQIKEGGFFVMIGKKNKI